MGMPFNADEVFEMAEQIERNGAKFYRAAAEKFPNVRQVLLELAAMEDDHEETFKAMRTELTTGQQAPLVFDPDGEAEMYLRVMADGHIFKVKDDPGELLAKKKTAEDVLNTAIDIEKDSVAFYAGLKEAVPKKAGKDKIEDIIRQELGHIAILDRRLDALKDG